jgi:hypothetical protein
MKYKKGDMVYISKGIKSEVEGVAILPSYYEHNFYYIIAGILREASYIEDLNA